MKHKLWLVVMVMFLVLALAACQSDEEVAEESESVGEAVAEEVAVPTGDGCPHVTMADSMSVPAGAFPQQYDLAEFERLADCMLSFSENPNIADLNARIGANPDLPPVEERLPDEPLVFPPNLEIGAYGGILNVEAFATEAGTAEILSIRHVNLVRFHDDILTIVPHVAKGWEWNDNFTEVTFFLRKGHKWSDGQPFTAADVEFWYNDLILNEEIYASPPSFWTSGGTPWNVEAVDETTVRFAFPAPFPGFLQLLSSTFAQPFQPKHFYEQYHIKYNPDADALAQEEGFESWTDLVNEFYGNSDWKDVPSALLKGNFDFVVPTLESHITVEDTPNNRNVVANPYFFIVDTAGNQLPYINEIETVFILDYEVMKLKIANGEIDYKSQSLLLEDFPFFKENEANGNYTVFRLSEPTGNQFYAPNTTHKDPEMAKIFNDVRFRQALSLAINRAEIKEIIHLGQGTIQQFVPIAPVTVPFVKDEHWNAFIEYDPDQANALLDEMGLVDSDGDGFREKLDGSTFSILLQYTAQETSGKMHELVRDYWGNVGVRVDLKEVTSDEYREQGGTNDLDIMSWGSSNVSTVAAVTNPDNFIPPFGDYWRPGPGIAWASWLNTDGAEGIEPPEDVMRLVELKDAFLKVPLGSQESNRIGEEILDIHAANLWKIGTVGELPFVLIRSNTMGNWIPFPGAVGGYGAYTYRSAQWFLNE